MKRRGFLALGAAGLLARAAQAQPAPEGRLYSPGSFDTLRISGSAEVRLQQGSTDEVFVQGNAEVQKQVQLSVRDGTLRIDSTGGWKFWSAQRLQLTVTVRQLSRLFISGAAVVHAPGPLQAGRLLVDISGAGLARLDQLQAERLAFSASGAGDADMAGQVDELSVSVSGRSEFRAENLMSRKARVAISGVADVKLWAVDELAIAISGIGHVEYWGTPRVRRGASGMSTVLPRGAKAAPGP